MEAAPAAAEEPPTASPAEASPAEMETDEPKEKEDGAEASEVKAPSLAEASKADGARLHVSCKNFVRLPQAKVEGFLAKTSPVELRQVFKIKGWGYAFVTVNPEDVDKFKEALECAEFRNSRISVKDGHARDENNRRPKGQEEPDAKRRKVVKEFPEGYIPTLKDIKEKQKAHKGAGIEKSIVQKSAPLLEWPYETQLKMKETYVKTAVRSFTKQVKQLEEQRGYEGRWTDPEYHKEYKTGAASQCGCPMDPIIGTDSDHIQGYRNKCEFSIGVTPEGAVECGFVLKVTQDGGQLVSGAEEIPHVSDKMKKLCRVVRDHVIASSHAVFERNRTMKSGVWRLVMVRQSPKGELLVMLQIASMEPAEREKLGQAFVKALVAADLNVVSVFVQENDSTSDAAPADAPLHHIHGLERLEMTQLGLKFEIGPLSFFQTNSRTCEQLYDQGLTWLRPEGGIVLDICCGVGTIGLCAASRCQRVVGLELVPEAVESAKKNAALNGITNASYHVGKAEHVLPDLLPKLLAEVGEDCEVCAMVDPPRAGLHKDVLTALRDCQQLSRIVYISCNPESLADDVTKLCSPKDGEDLLMPVRAVAVDMFPHTLHCEMVLLLERASKVKLTKPEPEPAPASPK